MIDNERDELARIVTKASDDDGLYLGHMTAESAADLILAAGYRKPRTVKSAAELEALQFGSAVQTSDPSDVVVLKSEGRYFRNQSCFELSVEDLWRYGTQPFTVIFEASPVTAPDPRVGEIQARSDAAMLHESLNPSDYAELAWSSARDVAYLVAELADRDEKLEKVEAVAADLAERGGRIEEQGNNGSIYSTRAEGRGIGYREGARLIRAAVAAANGGEG